MAKVLLVEDDESLCKYYSKLLSLSYETQSAKNGAEALEIAKSFNPDLILLDILMPVMNGVTTLQKLKSDPLTSSSKVIMLSNLDDDEYIRDAMKSGAEDYITKSNIDADSLEEKIRIYLQNNQK